MTVEKCVICGAMLPDDAGNRRRYCGQACKRSAEYEIRRTSALIFRSEKQIQDLGALPTRAKTYGQRVQPAGQLAYWTAERERLADRLRQLLDGGSES